MMKRWGLEGMKSFQQEGVAAKEATRLASTSRILEASLDRVDDKI